MKITKDLIKYDIETAVISALDTKYKDVQITDGKSYAVVMQGLAEYRGLRVKIDEKHRELKKDALEYGRAVDTEKYRLKALLEPGENHLKEIRQIEDYRKAAIKAEKDRKERERIEAIQEKINGIRHLGAVYNLASSHIEERLVIVRAMQISKDVYMEFMEQAIQTHKDSISALEKALADRLQFEKEEAERKAETERLEAQRKEQAEAQAKIDEENRKIDEESARIAKAHRKLEEEKRTEQARKEREEFEHECAIVAEQKAKEKVEREERERLEREEAKAKEKARQEALRPDREKLIKFADSLYNIPIPDVKSAEAQQILSDASDVLDELSMNMKVQAKEL